MVEKNPGIKFREIMRATGFKNGVLSHYMSRLEKAGDVRAVREPRQTRFYSPGISKAESLVIKSLRRDTTRKILYCLMLNKTGLGFDEIVHRVQKSPSTISLYISHLTNDGIVYTELDERRKKYFVSDRTTVDRLIERYHPGMLDRPAAGLEDVINSL